MARGSRWTVSAAAFLVTLALFSAPARAQGEGGKKAQGKDRPSREEALKKFDKNGDGKLDQEERMAMREATREKASEKAKSRRDEMLKRFDTNKDGKLDDAERKTMQESFKEKRKGKEKGKEGGSGEGSGDKPAEKPVERSAKV